MVSLDFILNVTLKESVQKACLLQRVSMPENENQLFFISSSCSRYHSRSKPKSEKSATGNFRNSVTEPEQASASSFPDVQICVSYTGAVLRTHFFALFKIHAFTEPGIPLNRIPFQGPDRYLGSEFSLRTFSGYPSALNPYVKAPLDGSSGVFHEDRYRSRPVIVFLPSFIPGSKVSHG
ncbi:hypothetical protein SADUNF_Sadunf16G0274200 [Salix dunnii]|uniref:Uncharacterized protein n=1 Tax=Salix dunnii TaxID=1413687 RepID=A0A835MI85_9ROSI|nr:hypothetical protein SADUNF_Sadunf16G0274200 [Salix dunnii]